MNDRTMRLVVCGDLPVSLTSWGEWLFDDDRHGRALTVPRCFACRLELGSRAEVKGGGAPTGMSATAAVAG